MSVDSSKCRRTLPAAMVDRSSYSIFSVIKQAVGKDLTRFSIPVVWNEPLSFLQRLTECLEYSGLLDRAALADSPVERLHLLTAFVVSNLSTHLERMSKPFNPLLGETYEFKREGQSPFHFVAEQVSHHPPVTAIHVRGENWILSTNVEPKIKFQGTNVAAISEGRWIFRIVKKSTLSRSSSQSSFHSCADDDDSANDGDADEYMWRIPLMLVHNILFGRLWCEFQGQIEVTHRQSNQRSLLAIKSHSWFSSQAAKTADLFKYTGFIYDGNEKLSAFHGNYGHCYYALDNVKDTPSKSSPSCSAGGHNCIQLSTGLSTPCDLLLMPSSRLVWHRSFSSITDDELASRSQYYFFSPYSMCLNQPVDSPLLPPTDVRHRQDIRHVEEGNLEAASAEKHRLEEQQRAEAKVRQGEFQPLWFRKQANGEYIYTGDYEQRNFAHCPNLFTQVEDSSKLQ